MKTRPNRKKRRKLNAQAGLPLHASNGANGTIGANGKNGTLHVIKVKRSVRELKEEIAALRADNESLRLQWDILTKTIAVLAGYPAAAPNGASNGHPRRLDGKSVRVSISGVFA